MITPELMVVSAPLDQTVSIPQEAITLRDETVAASKKITEVKFPNDQQLEIAVAALKEITGIEKQVNEKEEEYRKPHNKWLKDIRAMRDGFLAPVAAEKKRLSDLINVFQSDADKEKRARDRKALDDQRAAQAAADAAQRAADSAAKAIADAKDATAKAKAEADLIKAQLAQERADLLNSSAEQQLSIPTNTPRGLVTRSRFDFEILNPGASIATAFELWIWHKDTETLKFDRAGFLKALNADSPSTVILAMLPEETQQSVTLPKIGIRVFRDVRVSTR